MSAVCKFFERVSKTMTGFSNKSASHNCTLTSSKEVSSSKDLFKKVGSK